MNVLVSWSSGKDSAWLLHTLRQEAVQIAGLLTSFNEVADRVAMHAVRRELVEAQAAAAGLPLWPVLLPWPCTNALYEERMAAAIREAKEAGVTHMAFGDLFLEDIRDYRIQLLADTGIEPLFPLFGTPSDTPALSRTMLAAGLRARVTCVDTNQLDASFLGRTYDPAFVAELPPEVDACAENGEFHTFCYAGPMFNEPIHVRTGERRQDGPFHFIDLLPTSP